MFNVKKAIPRLAAGAMLALTGCSTGDGDPNGTGGTAGSGGTAGTGGTAGSGGTAGTGGTGGGPSDEVTAALDAWCMNAADCPDLGYTDKADCVRYINENFYIDAGDPVCDAAAISYLECGVNLNCVQLFN